MKHQVLRHLMCVSGRKLSGSTEYGYARETILKIVNTLTVEYSRDSGYLLRYELNGIAESTMIPGDRFVFHRRGDISRKTMLSEKSVDLERKNREEALKVWGQILKLNIVLNELVTVQPKRVWRLADFFYLMSILILMLFTILLEPVTDTTKSYVSIYLLLLGISGVTSREDNRVPSVLGLCLLILISIFEPLLAPWVLGVSAVEMVFQLLRRSNSRAMTALLCALGATGVTIQKINSDRVSVPQSFTAPTFLFLLVLTLICALLALLYGRTTSTLHWSSLLVGVGMTSLGTVDQSEFIVLLSAPLIVVLKVSLRPKFLDRQTTAEKGSTDGAVPVTLRKRSENLQ